MASEEARVEIRVSEAEDGVWLDTTVNGRYDYRPIQAVSLKDSETTAEHLKELLMTVYRRAYRDGHAACQDQIKNTLGVK